MLSSIAFLFLFSLLSLPLSKRIVPVLLVQPRVVKAITQYGGVDSKALIAQHGPVMVGAVSLSFYPLVLIGGEVFHTFYFVISFMGLVLVSFLVGESTREKTLESVKIYIPQLLPLSQSIVSTTLAVEAIVQDERGKLL